MKKRIMKIFRNLDIDVDDVIPATNSYNSNVYIVSSNDKKYVFKVNTKKSKTEVERKYMNYLHKYLKTPEVISSGLIDEKGYIIMTFMEGENFFDEQANELSPAQIRNIGILLGTMHNLKLIDSDNDSWVIYLKNALDKTQDVLKKVFGKDNEIIYNYLNNYILNNLKDNYKNSILHMDFRIGNLIIDNDSVGLIDMESMKNGEYVFDFVKLFRVFTKSNFEELVKGYKKVRNIDSEFDSKLNFYTLFDSYTSLWWSASRNKTDSDFYKMNYKIVKGYLGDLNEKGYI